MIVLITPLVEVAPEAPETGDESGTSDTTHDPADTADVAADHATEESAEPDAPPTPSYAPMYAGDLQVGINPDHLIIVEPITTNVSRLLMARGIAFLVEGTPAHWQEACQGDLIEAIEISTDVDDVLGEIQKRGERASRPETYFSAPRVTAAEAPADGQ